MEYGYGGQQNVPVQETRPRVDPEELGEVDPEKYGPSKDSTKKIRGRSDFVEYLKSGFDQELLIVKTFYFFFYSAFGSLFPLMGVYFKQMGMNPGQCGLLVGVRPFVEFVCAPFWGGIADRYQKGKTLLLASLGCWILFTLPMGFVQPPPTYCIIHNKTDYILEAPTVHRLLKREAVYEENHVIEKRAVRPYANAGMSPLDVSFAINYNEKLHKNWVSPLFSSIVYRVEDIQKAFFLLLLLVILGEFFSAPAITLADSAVITLLGEDADRYGHQRMFGSLGWGLAMFFVGIALDHSTAFPDHPCGPDPKEKNYTICFAIFSVLMGAALITATQIHFKYIPPPPPDEDKPLPPPTQEDRLQSEIAQQLGLPSLNNPTINSAAAQQQAPPNIGKTKIFAQTVNEMPEWVTVLKQFKNLKCASFLFVAWFMGFGIGLIFTFLFWHLQDYGGTPTLFGVASVINHISEIFAYFFSFRLITQMGHVKVLCLGLVGNILRFLYISWLTDPWWVLPFEFMQGITHATVWAACCSYIAHNTPQHLRSSGQGVLQGIHHGLGRGCGAVIGGLLVKSYGSTKTFRGYGFICILVLAAFYFINFYHKNTGFVSDLPPTEDPHQVAEETSHLAPHGVPSNPIPRALSSTRLHDLANQDYGSTYSTADGNLGVPGQGPNPFRQDFGNGENYNYKNYANNRQRNPFLYDTTTDYSEPPQDFGIINEKTDRFVLPENKELCNNSRAW